MQIKHVLLGVAIANFGNAACVQFVPLYQVLLGGVKNTCDPVTRPPGPAAPIACPASCLVTSTQTQTVWSTKTETSTSSVTATVTNTITNTVTSTKTTAGIAATEIAAAMQDCQAQNKVEPMFNKDGNYQCCAPVWENGQQIC